MLTTVRPQTLKPLWRQRRAGLIVALLFVLSIGVFLVQRFRTADGNHRQRKHGKRSGSASLFSSGDSRSSSSSASKRHKHGSGSGKHHHHHHHSRDKKLNSSLPTLCVLVGVHGSGKTTWAKQYIEKVRKSAVVVSSDTVRAAVTGSVDDYSREADVEAQFVAEIEQQVQLRHNIIVDDCQHNLTPEFRAKLLSIAKEGEYNRVMRRFPIEAIFARARIEKDLAEGKKRYDPTPLRLEELIVQFDAVDEAIQQEGWHEDT